MIRIGVLALQGDIEEHRDALKRAMEKMGIDGEVVFVRKKDEIKDLDALIIPGGESTTIGKLIFKRGAHEAVIELAKKGKPIMGTCAGMILLAKEIVGGKPNQPTLGLLDVKVRRNAFGRQRESFEITLEFNGVETEGVFIRAPAVEEVGEGVEVLSRLPDGTIVAVRQDNILALAFHPELSNDTVVYEYFLKMVLESKLREG